MARVDVVVGWANGWMKPAVLERVKAAFKYPTKFVCLPNPPIPPGKKLPAWNGYYPPSSWPLTRELWDGLKIQPARIALVGFSASCVALREVLASRNGGDVNATIAIDGIHGGLDVWTRWARFAAWGVPGEYINVMPGLKRCIITHSQVAAPNKDAPSSTESAERIWQDATGSPPTATPETPDVLSTTPHDPPISFGCSWHANRYTYSAPPYWYHRAIGGLDILGYRNVDPTGCTDHIYQAQVVLPLVLEHMLAPWWNAEPPSTGTCMIGA